MGDIIDLHVEYHTVPVPTLTEKQADFCLQDRMSLFSIDCQPGSSFYRLILLAGFDIIIDNHYSGTCLLAPKEGRKKAERSLQVIGLSSSDRIICTSVSVTLDYRNGGRVAPWDNRNRPSTER